MPTYRYVALSPDGRRQRDVLQAESERQARQLLHERGLFPRRLALVRGAEAPGRSAGRGRLDTTSLALLTRQLATLIDAGIPLSDALDALTRQAERQRERALLLAVGNRVREGHSLADSLKPHASFDLLYRSLVAAGERAGRLALVLERLADHLERVQAQRQKARTALVYPLVLAGVSLAVVSGLMTWVVPRLAQQFERSDMALPWLTRLMIGLSHLMLSLGPWLLALLLLGLPLTARVLRRPAPRARLDALLLGLPRLGELIRLLDTGRLTRTLAILTRSGIALLEALRVSRDTLGNHGMREAVALIEQRVESGISLHRAMQESGRFSPSLLHMVASGEASGTLDRMLERIADAQESTFNRRVDMALALFEPLMILVMGAVVLTVVLAILLPIMQLNSSVAL
ncbi:type II secretion system inner membrane protein GspF [Salinicola sp. DM10]|uniref:type II secretion system inner membrane protein GspF n=1 Tax=Salinicola sp. DM10 TaxID=2815721 RepID=UPI001A8F2670|nr:type II secretion system inner membrane protein GspF [Salinicola sp. DM10]MCE3026804.1 type II secretion system inner membrane protein GspF [Salinicola sp. DM10]